MTSCVIVALFMLTSIIDQLWVPPQEWVKNHPETCKHDNRGLEGTEAKDATESFMVVKQMLPCSWRSFYGDKMLAGISAKFNERGTFFHRHNDANGGKKYRHYDG